jgi:hypothetical protein
VVRHVPPPFEERSSGRRGLARGDVDEGGFRIASRIAEIARASGHILKPYRMSPDDVPEEFRVQATVATLLRMERYAAAAGWVDLAREIGAAGFTGEQEAL